jgi:hypothetical protein
MGSGEYANSQVSYGDVSGVSHVDLQMDTGESDLDTYLIAQLYTYVISFRAYETVRCLNGHGITPQTIKGGVAGFHKSNFTSGG